MIGLLAMYSDGNMSLSVLSRLKTSVPQFHLVSVHLFNYVTCPTINLIIPHYYRGCYNGSARTISLLSKCRTKPNRSNSATISDRRELPPWSIRFDTSSFTERMSPLSLLSQMQNISIGM